MNSVDIGKLIRERRQASGMSQTQLGKRAGVSGPTISVMERGLGQTSYALTTRVAQLLDIPINGNEPGERVVATYALQPVVSQPAGADAFVVNRLAAKLGRTPVEIAQTIDEIKHEACFAVLDRLHGMTSDLHAMLPVLEALGFATPADRPPTKYLFGDPDADRPETISALAPIVERRPRRSRPRA